MAEKTEKFQDEVQKKRNEIAASIKKFWKSVEEKRKELFVRPAAPKGGTALKKTGEKAEKKAKKAKPAKLRSKQSRLN